MEPYDAVPNSQRRLVEQVYQAALTFSVTAGTADYRHKNAPTSLPRNAGRYYLSSRRTGLR